MATLKLRHDEICCDPEEICREKVLNSDDDEFMTFRKRFYEFQFKFAVRSQHSNKRTLVFFRNLARDKDCHNIFGVSGNMLTLVTKFRIDLYVDFAISKRKAKEIFNKTAKDVWNQIDSKFATNGRDVFVLNDFPITANGKKADISRLFATWDTVLKVYDLYDKQEKKNYAAISREMEWFDKHERHHCSEEVKNYLEYANKLIEAASKNQLYEEACKPMTIGKNRKQKGK